MISKAVDELYIYNRFEKRLFDQEPNIHMFGSSSKGNSIYLKNLRTVIDLGMSYKTYSDYDPDFFLKIDYIFLTHEHGDHLKPSTLMKILRMYPNVKFIISRRMAKTISSPEFKEKIDQIELTKYYDRFLPAKSTKLTTRDNIEIYFKPYVTEHGKITNIAIALTVPYYNKHILYASDLDTFGTNNRKDIDGLPKNDKNPFNLIFLEANYDETLVKAALDRDPYDIKARGNLRHTSEQTAWKYVAKYLTDDGIFIPLHASSTYGTLIQPTNKLIGNEIKK